ncbi:MAG: substrate-binding domain-containing protein [Chitinophagales bacterium]|nr:substrate-binding domain-containing protein [Chitinophagales bacterium]
MKKILFPILLLVFFSCKRNHPTNTNTYFSGTTTIYADIQLKYLIDQLVQAFENIYDKSTINVVYKNEEDLIKAYLYDSLQNIIISRSLSDTEIIYHNQHTATNGKQMVFAYDALAFITSKNNSVSSLDINKLNSFNNLFFSNAKSGVPKKIISITKDSSILSKAAVIENIDELIGNLDKYPNSVAVVNYSVFSNPYDKKHLERRNQIKVLAVQEKDTTIALNQNNIAKEIYPKIYQKQLTVAFNESVDPLVKGFVNFIFKDRAAKICIHSGLVPHAIPELQVKLVTE